MAKRKGSGKKSGGSKKAKKAAKSVGPKNFSTGGHDYHCHGKRVKNSRGSGTHPRAFCRRIKK